MLKTFQNSVNIYFKIRFYHFVCYRNIVCIWSRSMINTTSLREFVTHVKSSGEHIKEKDDDSDSNYY